MKHTLPLTVALFFGSAALAAVQAIPLYTDDLTSSSGVQVASKAAKKKGTETVKVKPKGQPAAGGY
jgi:hypothetical protein